jgi:TPR repeat protein
MNYSTAPIAMNSNELSNAMRDVVMATHDPAKLARLRRVAASGKVGEDEGQEARREAAWRLGLYYSAQPAGSEHITVDYVTLRQKARDFDASLKHLVAAALDGHAEASFRVSVVTALKEKYEAEEAGVLRTGNASKQFHWLRRAADGGHIVAIMNLADSILNDKDHSDFVKQTLKMTEKDGLSYYQKAADRNCGEAFIHLAYLASVSCDGNKAGVDRDLSRAEKLLDESEKPGTFWLSGPREDFKQSMEDIKCTIIHERLLRGGDEDAKGYSFVHDALKIPPDDKLNLNVSNAYRCGTCKKAVPEVAELKICKTCRAMHYCSKECQRTDWPRHKMKCFASIADIRGLRKWYTNCPGLHAAVTLAAYINLNATPVILVRTKLGDDGLHPVVTVLTKREVLDFEGGWMLSQDPEYRSTFPMVPPRFGSFTFASILSISALAIHAIPSRCAVDVPGDSDKSRSDVGQSDDCEDSITTFMTWVALNTGRAAEVREHTNLERPPRP